MRQARVIGRFGSGLVVALALAAPMAAVAQEPDVEISVSGTVLQVAAEAPDAPDGLEIRTFVDVAGTLVELPEELTVGGATGTRVQLEIAAEAGTDPAEVVAEVRLPEPADSAVVVEATPLAAATTQPLAAASLGAHTLHVLPVYWSAPDGATRSSLSAVASTTASYWSRQSAGRLTVATDVRDWAQVADPGSCDESALWQAALTAHGITSLGATEHVLVYFPQRGDCGGWAGLASVGGQAIWVNGYQLSDVWSHEFGHNLGLGHANTMTCQTASGPVPLLVPQSGCSTDEYGDWADVMGIGTTMATGNLTTALADHLGLVQVVRPVAGSTTEVTLAPLASTGSVRSVALPVTGGTVYVDFRPAVAPDVRRTDWAGVQVHLRTINPTYGYPTSYLLDMTGSTGFASPALADGAVWAVPGTGQEVAVLDVGSTATVVVRPAGSGGVTPAVEAYITRVYLDLFGRSVDSGGLATWAAALMSGTPRVAVANAITGSTEYRSGLIQESYRRYLERSADRAGLAFWLEEMQRGRTIGDMESGFLASDEYYLQAGGDDAQWVRELYRHVLGRSAASAEVTFWVGQVRAQGRYGVARGFLHSTEHLTTVIDGYYQDLLGRRIDPSGRRTWVTAIQTGTRLEQVIGAIVGSDEYYARS